ncbi:MAG TPA: hypothetical protein VNH11_14170 [Pirellulales bacterium]|nr:hypothetical protein [Pirellulales bacterium]
MAAGDDPRYVRVVCSKCRAVLHPRVEKAGRHVRCPDCYSAVLVPQPSAPERPPKTRDPGAYGVREALAPARDETHSADFFPVLCPTCQARLHPRRSHVGKRARCPDCDTVFVVPPPREPTKAKPLPSPGKYAVGEESKRVEAEFHYLTVDRVTEPEPLAPPEQGWFVRGVFTFPWWPGAGARWMVLAMLFVPALFVAGVVAFLAGSQGVDKAMTVAVYLILPLIWTWVWALSYAAACFVAIVQDTGSGNDEVSNWPEGDWRERVITLLYVGLHFALAVAAGSALAWPVGMFFGPLRGALATALAANLFFPLFMLSSMEADTLLVPYSPVMYGSLLKVAGGWLLVYIESLLAVGLTVGLLTLGVYWLPMVALPLSPLLLATLVFIEARLYGRLAWHIGQAETRRKPRKKKKAGPPAKRTDVSRLSIL